jgi:hypothetical protein
MSVFPPHQISGPSPSKTGLASTRTLSRICGSVGISGLDKRETATVLSIAHLTDWSAELIANKVHEYLGTSISSEKVWDTYKEWEDARNEDRLDGPTLAEDVKTNRFMVEILEEHEIKPNFRARPLSRTPRPVSSG